MSELHAAGARRAGAGRLDRRRPGHLRHRELRGQPALGGQQPDHQRRDALAAGRRRLVRRRRRRHGRRHRRPHRDAGHRRAGRRQRAGRPRRRTGRGRRAADQRDARRRRRLGRRAGRDLDRGVRRVRARRWARPSARRATATSCCSASPSTRWRRRTSARSTGLRLRHDQPTGRVELNGKSPDFGRSVWAGVGTRDFRDVSVADLAADVAAEDGLVAAPDRPARRALRDAAAAVGGQRPDDLPLLDDGGPRRRRGPQRLRQARRRQPHRRAAGRAAADAAQRPRRAGPGDRARSRSWAPRPGSASVFDNGMADAGGGLDRRTAC